MKATTKALFSAPCASSKLHTLPLDQRRAQVTLGKELFHPRTGLWGSMLRSAWKPAKLSKALAALGPDAATREARAAALLLPWVMDASNALKRSAYEPLADILRLKSPNDAKPYNMLCFDCIELGLCPPALTTVLAFYFFALAGRNAAMWTEDLQGVVETTDSGRFDEDDIATATDDVTALMMETLLNVDFKQMAEALSQDDATEAAGALSDLRDDMPEVEIPDFDWLFAAVEDGDEHEEDGEEEEEEEDEDKE